MATTLGSRMETASLLSKSRELQSRIMFVLGALIVYRLGTHVPIPGIDALALAQYQASLQEGLFGMFNMFSGGAFSRMTIFALSVMPYITASIIMQLMSSVSTSLAEMKKEGEQGRRKITQYTRYFTVILAFAQGFGMAAGMEGATVSVGAENLGVVLNPGLAFRLETALTLMAGTMFLMWLGEQITSRGIGNGLSVIIFAGIVAELPTAVYQIVEQARVGALADYLLIGVILLAVFTIFAVVFMETAQRRVLVQYPKRAHGGGGESSFMPLKLNTAGVIPAIFASSLLLMPMSVASFNPDAAWAQTMGALFAPGRPMYIALFVALIVFFCFFYTALVFNSEETADNLKKNGGFIPGVRPGKATADYFDKVLARLTTVGAIYMSIVCILPQFIINEFNIPASAAYLMGGTSLLIVVSVTIDLVTRIQSHMMAQKYESLLKKSAFRGKRKK